MLPHFNHGLQCLCLGQLRCQGIHLKPREGVERIVTLCLVARPPPQSARYLPPWGGPYPQTSDDDVTSDGGLVDPSSHRKGKRSCGSRGGRSGEGSDSLVGKRVIQVRSLMPSDSGLGASPATGTTMRTLT